MQNRDDYLKFYNTAFNPGKHCTKSWGLASFEAGAQSRQTEIDDLVDMVKTSADSEMNLFDELQRVNKDRDELQKQVDMLKAKVQELWTELDDCQSYY